VNATWLEDPFNGGAYDAYGALSRKTRTVKRAGWEASHNYYMAEQLMKYGGVGYIQIDCVRIGGLGPAKGVADYAAATCVTYVNHTFTSHLALAASIQPFAGLESHRICEYPVAPKSLAWDLSRTHLKPNINGEITLSDAPGLGIEVDLDAVRRYLVEVEIEVGGKKLFSTVRP